LASRKRQKLVEKKWQDYLEKKQEQEQRNKRRRPKEESKEKNESKEENESNKSADLKKKPILFLPKQTQYLMLSKGDNDLNNDKKT
jgi:hypothetical protein